MGVNGIKPRNIIAHMEIIQASECFKPVDGGFEFIYTAVLFKHDDYIHRGCCPYRTKDTPFREREFSLYDIVTIPKDAYCPLAPPHCTIVRTEMPNCYIKRPNLMAYSDGTNLHEYVLKDIEACEILRQHPHPNIARYHGCQVDKDQRVIGLLFEKYQETLMERLNPGYLNKLDFLSARPSLPKEITDGYLRDIKSGIRHLHSLGLVHNDINPNNIMFQGSNVPVIIDFDSCRQPGSLLDSVERTHEWHNNAVRFSTPKNDFDSLHEIQIWMTGTSKDSFKL